MAAPRDLGLARQVVSHILNHGADSNGQTRLEVRLDPPELGRVDVSLDISDRQTRIHLVADRWMTADLLRRNADILIQQLRDAGFSALDLHFSDRGGSEAAAAMPRPEQLDGEPEPPRSPVDTTRKGAARLALYRSRPGGLDLKV